MKEVFEIDEELNIVLEKLREDAVIDLIIDKLNSQMTSTFRTNVPQNMFDKIDDLPGLYLFEIKNDRSINFINQLKIRWDKKNIPNLQHTPRIIKKRIGNRIFNDDWIALYLGINRNVKNRVIDHFFLEANKPTFALKLKARHQKLKNYEFRVKWICFEGIIEYGTVMSILEAYLREKLNPITGRQ